MNLDWYIIRQQILLLLSELIIPVSYEISDDKDLICDWRIVIYEECHLLYTVESNVKYNEGAIKWFVPIDVIED